jgi:peptidoglycan/LPS O-acetylase OafA/YrhL
LHLAKTDPITVYYNGFPSRLLEFVIGFYIGYFKVDICSQNNKKYFGIMGASLFFILAVVLNRLGGWNKLSEAARLSATIFSIAGGLALLQWAIKLDTINRMFPRLNLIMRRIGQISYSIYMIHFAIIYLIAIPIYNIAKNYFSDDLSLLAAIIMLGLSTISISIITYNLIERPFLKYRPKYLINEEKPEKQLL